MSVCERDNLHHVALLPFRKDSISRYVNYRFTIRSIAAIVGVKFAVVAILIHENVNVCCFPHCPHVHITANIYASRAERTCTVHINVKCKFIQHHIIILVEVRAKVCDCHLSNLAAKIAKDAICVSHQTYLLFVCYFYVSHYICFLD